MVITTPFPISSGIVIAIWLLSYSVPKSHPNGPFSRANPDLSIFPSVCLKAEHEIELCMRVIYSGMGCQVAVAMNKENDVEKDGKPIQECAIKLVSVVNNWFWITEDILISLMKWVSTL